MPNISKKLSTPVLFLASEFVVIVLGVLVALAVDQWNEARTQRELRSHFIEGLIADLLEDSLDYALFLSGEQARIDGANVLLAYAGDPEAEPAPPGITYGEAFTKLGALERLETVEATFLELTASGAALTLRNARLSASISHYYGLARDRGDINDTNLPGRLAFHRAMEDYGYSAWIDGDRIDVGRVLGDPRMLAIIRGLRHRAKRGLWAGGEMMEANRTLLSELRAAAEGST
jgi:hypothetical protein